MYMTSLLFMKLIVRSVYYSDMLELIKYNLAIEVSSNAVRNLSVS